MTMKTSKKPKILGVAILGSIVCLVILGVVWRNASSVPTQPERRIVPTRSTIPKTEMVYPIRRKPVNYDIIAENSLFRPLGWQRDDDLPMEQIQTTTPEHVVETPSPSPSYGLALTGIVKKGTHFIAVIEDQKINTGMFLRRGEALKDTKIEEITPNYITLAREEMTVQLALGEGIKYGPDGRMLFGTVTKQQEVERPTESDNSEQTLIERLRERRRTELNQ